MTTSMSRRDFFPGGAVLAGAASGLATHAVVQSQPPSSPGDVSVSAPGGLLVPQQNRLRNVLDTSGIWLCQLDPREEGEANSWFNALPRPRPIAVPRSWTEAPGRRRRSSCPAAALGKEAPAWVAIFALADRATP